VSLEQNIQRLRNYTNIYDSGEFEFCLIFWMMVIRNKVIRGKCNAAPELTREWRKVRLSFHFYFLFIFLRK